MSFIIDHNTAPNPKQLNDYYDRLTSSKYLERSSHPKKLIKSEFFKFSILNRHCFFLWCLVYLSKLLLLDFLQCKNNFVRLLFTDWLGFFWFVWCGSPPSSANQPTYQTQTPDPTPIVKTDDSPPIETVELNIQG